MDTNIQYRPLCFFSITFIITWIAWFIAAFFSYQEGMKGLQMLFMAPGLFAPFIAVLFLMRGAQNKPLRKDFWNRLSIRRIKLSYLPSIIAIMPLTIAFATALSLLFGQSASQFNLSTEFKAMDGQAFLSILILFLAPALEELGWRGYGVDSIRVKFDLFRTTLIFALLWALWHVPLFFINGYYHHGLWKSNLVYVINFFVAIFPAAVLTNWMYYKNNRSIMIAVLFHFSVNLFSGLFQTEQFTKCIVTILLSGISIAIIFKDKDFFFGTIPAISQ